jgi:hypothetical protein
MKFGIRTPSLKKRIAARTSWKRYVRHNLGFKAPRGWGWLTNPKRAAYNRVYNRTSVSVERLFSSRRRRASSGGSGIAVVLIVGVAIAAAVGVYLLVIAAVALVAWIIRVVARSRSSAPGEPLHESEPAVEYEQVAEVEPGAFEDDERVKRAARVVFSGWTARLPKAPQHSDDLVRGIEVHRQYVARLETAIEGRRFVERTAVAPVRAPLSGPAIEVTSLDPWNPPADLGLQTKAVTTCRGCGGEGRVACSNCGGRGRVACLACAGAGKYYGTTANGAHRMLNCKGCKGKGTVTCGTCIKGITECAACGGSRKVESWFDVEWWKRDEVLDEPPGEPFAESPVVVNIAASGAITPAQVPSSVPHECWSQLRSALQPGERITRQRLVIAERPSVRVSYAVRGVTDAVTFVGPKLLVRADAHDQAFTARAKLLSRIKIMLAIIPASLTVSYAARGPYFVGNRAGLLVAGAVASAAGFALCVYAMTWYATLRRRAARAWGVAAVAAMIAAVGFAIAVEPSVARAQGYLASGQLDAAEAELEALGPATEPALASTWADLHLKQTLVSSSCASAAAIAARIPNALPQHAAAVGHADELAIREATRELERRDPGAASAALDCASPAARDGQVGRKISAEIKLAAGDACLRTSDWKCVFARADEADRLGGTADAAALRDRGLAAVQATFRQDVTAARSEKKLEDRARLEHAALDLWALYLATRQAKKPTGIAALKISVARDDAAIARAQELERRRAAADERRRIAAEQHERALQEAAARRQRAREEAAERARAYSPLVCGDGTLSPTCVCGGSWRGCCSHHQGVSGCQGQ